ncbi:hypothetical protein ANN_06839 [Periplaneta americana]|uniref:Uncharacterized protein n=1 Tax=Periplaneta americana TaxID=6978 RepID=A0ABQ8TGQ2_PERAM|nr:hypothetical protein ANN_06839 [Periplaneta americana]
MAGLCEGGNEPPGSLEASDNASEMSPGSSTESYPAFARIGLMENPGKYLNQRREIRTHDQRPAREHIARASRGKGKGPTRRESGGRVRARNCCVRKRGGRTLPTLRDVRRSGDIQIILCTPVEISRNYDFAIKEETPANSSRVFQLISQPVSEKARASKPVLCTGVRLECASATVSASEGLSSSAVDRSWRDPSSSAVDRSWRDLSSSTVNCL